ncbi:PREDICTED: LOW QUALITY PROTEIN: leiomodin-1 [Leptosomus discolor]|uniref:LOW QUALITY PROTEIN: leiomodin-1 n=1 Tax=Leptosomus discolor TaxID=188344 RepID=UPI000522CA38|nr:PREDICTED: LOW QUALITY PROTEIN: leiomodin-1 [Leptosomus discolor]
MSKVAKYRRQVSEDPDIDSLLSTLSPEEMEELEKELDVVDPDGGIPLELSQKNQTENSSAGPQNCDTMLNHCEKETRKLIQRERSIDESRWSEKNKGAKNEEEKGKEEERSKDLSRKRDTKVGFFLKESKKEESGQKTDPKAKAEAETKTKEEKAINDKVKAMEKKLMGKDKKEEEKGSLLKKDTGKDKKEEEKGSALKKDMGKDKKEEEKGSALKKDTGKDKKEEEKGSALKKDAGKAKKEEEKSSAANKEAGKDKKEEEKGSALKKGAGKDKKEEEKSLGAKQQAEKDTTGEDKKEKDKKEEEKSSALKKSKADEKKSQPEAEKAAEEKQEAKAAADSSPSKPTTGSSSDQAKDDEASSIFDELIEKVKNNDAEVTEVNVNNSDCINNETLVRFTEALEFNTVVKLFALANTRADDHVAFAIAIMLKSNKVLTSINLDSNHITGKGILAIFRALLQNNTLTELRFHNQRHICGGKTEMEIAKLLKENTTLLKLGYHFELAGPRMTVTNLLSRNMDKQRQKRLQEQKLAQERGEKKDLLEVPKPGALPKGSPKPSPQPSPKASPKSSPKKGGAPAAPPPPPPPLAPPLINENLRNSLSPATQRKLGDRALPVQEKNSRDQLLAAIRSSNLKQLKKVEVPKLLQ